MSNVSLLLPLLLVANGVAEPPAALTYAVPKNLAGVVFAEKARRLPRAAREALCRDAAVTVRGDEPHFFALYERNAYERLPSFVTADTVLHAFHQSFDRLLADLEVELALPALRDFARRQSEKALAAAAARPQEAKRFLELALYHAVPLALLSEGDDAADGPHRDPRLAARVEAWVQKIHDARDRVTEPLCPRAVDATLFKPRGHYASWRLERYFRAMTFYGQCRFALDDPAQLDRAVEVVRALDADAVAALERVERIVTFLFGQRPSARVALSSLVPTDAPAWPAPLSAAQRRALAAAAATLAPGRVPQQTAPDEPSHPELTLVGAVETSDSALFALTADWEHGRPFASVLDLLSVLGSADARTLLAADVGRVPRLAAALAAPFDRGHGVYGRWLELLALLVGPAQQPQPSFARTPAWRRHETLAAAGSWAELRHDTILYVKQPLVWAEGGHDAELPATKVGGYVEPRPELYRALRALLADLEALAPKTLAEELAGLTELLDFLAQVADLEVAARPLPPAMDERLRWVGQELERLARGHGDELPPQAVIADFYTHADADGTPRTLHAATGRVDELWVVVPRAGKLVLMRGGVFSYYEHVAEPGVRLADEDWEELLVEGRAPAPPAWAQPLPAALRKRRAGN